MLLKTFKALLLLLITLCVNWVFTLICMKTQIWDKSELVTMLENIL